MYGILGFASHQLIQQRSDFRDFFYDVLIEIQTIFDEKYVLGLFVPTKLFLF